MKAVANGKFQFITFNLKKDNFEDIYNPLALSPPSILLFSLDKKWILLQLLQ